MNINIKNLWVLNVAGVEVWITETIFNTWIIMIFLIVLALIARIKLKSFKTIPRGAQNAIEAIVEIFDNFAVDTLGEKLSYIAPWYFTVFVYLITCCIFSVFGLRAPSADFATTFALALAGFLLMIILGLKHRKEQYLKSFFEPNLLFFPLNLIGELSKPISLSFRLFGNMLSGTIILTMYYGLTPLFVQFGIPVFLHAFFDVLFGGIQAYVFVIISLMYVKG
ncbi:MAG TPA: FoF1 ATP synthase subunit a [Sedimentibacter sp.]|jgi:F-type H+-transporting ATPase subunit a|nr:FoF1 ATP synthase subunit a [Sedimentibacter sp.]